MTRICVIGGCGYFGQRLVDRLASLGHYVTVFDLADPPQNPRPSVNYIRGDVRKHDEVANAIKDVVAQVNVDGVSNVIRASQVSCRVKYLIYTSFNGRTVLANRSMDVCYEGQPIRNRNEDLPYASTFLNAYIATKGEAERRILRANGESVSTCALRPAHIYGPGDMMIGEIIHRVGHGQVPARFGDGTNDYIYIENCVSAHIDCLHALSCGNTQPAGTNVGTHPFLKVAGLSAPRRSIPFMFVYFLAVLTEYWCQCVYFVTRISLHPNTTRYIVSAVSQDLYFNSSRAKDIFWKTENVPRTVAVEQTISWAKTLREKPFFPEAASKITYEVDRCIPCVLVLVSHNSPLQLEYLHAFHMLYGLLLAVVGVFGFFYPRCYSEYFGIRAYDIPSSGALIAQTSGLIIFILCECIPPSFWIFVAVELSIGFATALYSRPHRPVSFFFGKLSFSQGLHAVASGSFAMAMMIWPEAVLSNLVPLNFNDSSDLEAAIIWGHVMGAAEFMMTWTYAASACVTGMERFAWLSVITRLGAVIVLWISFASGHSCLQQAIGVTPDGFLALLSLWILRSQQPLPYVHRGFQS
eukprot:gene2464-5398_t